MYTNTRKVPCTVYTISIVNLQGCTNKYFNVNKCTALLMFGYLFCPLTHVSFKRNNLF